jgi:hypothetical protein
MVAKIMVAKYLSRNFGRSTRIRTLDPLVPNQVRYQTAPHSEARILTSKISVFRTAFCQKAFHAICHQ